MTDSIITLLSFSGVKFQTCGVHLIYLGLLFAFLATKSNIAIFRRGYRFEFSEAKVTDAMNTGERRMRYERLRCEDEISASDPPSREHASPCHFGDRDSNRRGSRWRKFLILRRRGSAVAEGKSQKQLPLGMPPFQLPSPTAISIHSPSVFSVSFWARITQLIFVLKFYWPFNYKIKI